MTPPIPAHTPTDAPPDVMDLQRNLQAYERRLSRLLIAFLGSGLVFLLGPGSFLGLWNLLAISRERTALAISPAWLQAHGHAEIYGFVGSFILGIGFHSLTRLRQARVPMRWGWSCWVLWTLGVSLRWYTGVSDLDWRLLLPLSAALELTAFLIFQATIAQQHRRESANPQPGAPTPPRGPLPGWILLVFTGAMGFLTTLVLNLGGAVYLAVRGAGRTFPAGFDHALVELILWMFLTPFILGFSTRWFPIFAGLHPAPAWMPRAVVPIVAVGAISTLAGWTVLASLAWLAVAVTAVTGLHLYVSAAHPAKTKGVHPSFRLFLRFAYVWLLVGAALDVWAALRPDLTGASGAGRHAMTVGFVAGMVLCIGPRVLPAFAGMRVLYSPRLMLAALALLHAGCLLRVSGELLAYQGWVPLAWHWLPLSAVVEVTAFTLFAYNLVRTLLQPPAHLMRASAPA